MCEPRARLGRSFLATFRMASCSVIDLLSARMRPRLNVLFAELNQCHSRRFGRERRAYQSNRPACQNKQGVLTAASKSSSSWNLLGNSPEIPIRPDGRR